MYFSPKAVNSFTIVVNLMESCSCIFNLWLKIDFWVFYLTYPHVLFWVCSKFPEQFHILLFYHTQICLKTHVQKNSCFLIWGPFKFRLVYLNSSLISFCWFVRTNLYNVPHIDILKFQEQLHFSFPVVEIFSIKVKSSIGWKSFRYTQCCSLFNYHLF